MPQTLILNGPLYVSLEISSFAVSGLQNVEGLEPIIFKETEFTIIHEKSKYPYINSI